MVDVFFQGYGAWLVFEDEDASYPISERYRANGVFSLTEDDEIKYRHTGSLKAIVTLCPSDHPNSEFTKMVSRGKFDSQLTKHSDNDFFKKERRGEFNDDLEKAVQHHQEEKAAEFHDLAKVALFQIDTKKKYILEIVNVFNPKNIKTTVTENERTIMLKLILCMAIDAYRYDPDSKKNSATGENKGSIKAAMENLGLGADEKTISKYLKEATELFPGAKRRVP